MPIPKPVCITKLYKQIVQPEVCRTCSSRGMGINGTAQYGMKEGLGWLACTFGGHVVHVAASSCRLLAAHELEDSGRATCLTPLV